MCGSTKEIHTHKTTVISIYKGVKVFGQVNSRAFSPQPMRGQH